MADECPKCGKDIYSELFDAWRGPDELDFELQCPHCKSHLVAEPEMEVSFEVEECNED